MISAVILTKNEEKNISRSIKSVEFCDEILLIDDYSSDNTVNIAEELGAIVYQRKLEGDFGRQRNFGLTKSRGEWILFVDADEEVSENLQKEIGKIVKNRKAEADAYYIKRRDYWWGRELKFGEVLPARKKGFMRLAKKNCGKWFGSVHEVFRPLTASTKKLNSFLNHYPHQTIKEFLKEINFYSSVRARELAKMKKNITLGEIILFPIGKFIQNYIIRLGFLDGPAGFVYAFLMSFHSYLVRVKLYQYIRLEKV